MNSHRCDRQGSLLVLSLLFFSCRFFFSLKFGHVFVVLPDAISMATPSSHQPAELLRHQTVCCTITGHAVHVYWYTSCLKVLLHVQCWGALSWRISLCRLMIQVWRSHSVCWFDRCIYVTWTQQIKLELESTGGYRRMMIMHSITLLHQSIKTFDEQLIGRNCHRNRRPTAPVTGVCVLWMYLGLILTNHGTSTLINTCITWGAGSAEDGDALLNMICIIFAVDGAEINNNNQITWYLLIIRIN